MAITPEDLRYLTTPGALEKHKNLNKAYANAVEAGDTASADLYRQSINQNRLAHGYTTDEYGNFAGLTEAGLASINAGENNPLIALDDSAAFLNKYQQMPDRTSILRSGANLAKQFGDITYDDDEILNKFNKATQDEYAALRQDYNNTADDFYTRLGATQTAATDAIRRMNAQAIATGASRGMQAANELGAILGLQDTAVADATQLAQDKIALDLKERAAMSKNVEQALTQSNTTKQQLASLSKELFGIDTQYDVAGADYTSKIAQTEGAYRGQDGYNQATIHGADQQLEGVRDTNYSNNLMNIRDNETKVQIQKLVNEGIITQNQANVMIAQINSEASKYAVDNQKPPTGGGGGGGSSSSGGSGLGDKLANNEELRETAKAEVRRRVASGEYYTPDLYNILDEAGYSPQLSEEIINDIKRELAPKTEAPDLTRFFR